MQPLASIFFKKLQLKTSQSVGENSVKKKSRHLAGFPRFIV